MQALILILGFLFVVIVLIVLFNTFKRGKKQPLPLDNIDFNLPHNALAHFQQAIKIKTISYEDKSRIEGQQFLEFHRFLERTYPELHRNLKPEVVNQYSLLYKWEGTDASLKPAVLMSHIDVVPAEDESNWEAPPFAGEIKDGYLYGRGTIDNKMSLVCMMESVEELLKEGFHPQRTIYLAIGHDEERSGVEGAAALAELLKQRGIEAAFVLDEGLAVTKGIITGIDEPVALIGTTEKGFVSLKLSVKQTGGHSSTPPPETAVDILSKAVVKINENPLPARFCATFAGQMEFLAPHMGFLNRIALSNRWLFEELILKQMGKSAALNAATRTTIAATMFYAGEKDNILPQEAHAILNVRILPGDTLESVIEHVRKVISDDRTVIEIAGTAQEAGKETTLAGKEFNMLSSVIKAAFPEAIVSLSLVIGATDSRYYTAVSNNVFRFLPLSVTAEDLNRIHGTNERVAVKDFERALYFYFLLLKNL